MPRSAEKPQEPKGPPEPRGSSGTTGPSKGPAPPRLPKPISAEEMGDLTAVPLGKSSDEDLMRRTQGDDKQAYTLIYERYSASVLSYLYRMLGNVEDVESIAQEVFLRAYRFRATYRYPQRFSTWLFTITRNLAINQGRRRNATRCATSPNCTWKAWM